MFATASTRRPRRRSSCDLRRHYAPQSVDSPSIFRLGGTETILVAAMGGCGVQRRIAGLVLGPVLVNSPTIGMGRTDWEGYGPDHR